MRTPEPQSVWHHITTKVKVESDPYWNLFVEGQVLKFLSDERVAFPSNRLIGLKTALREAFINAIKHGNWNDCWKKEMEPTKKMKNKLVTVSVAVKAITPTSMEVKKSVGDTIEVVRRDVCDRILTITIDDRGKGFSPDDVANPTDPDRIELEYGRGILMMNHYCDQVVYPEKQGGRRVVMTWLYSSKEGGSPPVPSEAFQESPPGDPLTPDGD
ncbi:MAG: ATP-binding protein [Candidatus Peregrinibacteria bacterium]|nr:ATP-binding protein [Candidatus Peregrinibacteria bacterium]